MQRVIEVALGTFLGNRAKAGKPRLAQDSVQTIDETLTLRVKGTVSKGTDSEYTPTADIPIKLALALVLEKAGYGRVEQRENAVNLLVEAMSEALMAGGEPSEAIAERIKDIDKAMGLVKAGLAELPVKTRNGSVKVAVTVEEVTA
jgi:hypothetical protein